jgi:hypothetical protein
VATSRQSPASNLQNVAPAQDLAPLVVRLLPLVWLFHFILFNTKSFQEKYKVISEFKTHLKSHFTTHFVFCPKSHFKVSFNYFRKTDFCGVSGILTLKGLFLGIILGTILGDFRPYFPYFGLIFLIKALVSLESSGA